VIFVQENAGEEFSILSGLKIYGTPIETMNVASIHDQKKE